MGKIILRDYQEKLIRDARKSLAENKRIIVQSTTGSGKTRTFARMVKLSYDKGCRVLIVSHRIEIVKQNAAACVDEGVPTTIISPRLRKVPQQQVCSAMAQTLLRRVEKEEWVDYIKSVNMLIIDEAHDSSSNFIFDYLSDRCFVLGFTATPVRYGSQRQLGLDYNDIVTGPSVQFLVDNGYLCKCRLFSLDAPKMDDVEFDSGRGDFALGQMSKRFAKKTRYVGAVDNWERIARGTKTVVFCCSSEQTIGITKEFCARGYRAKYCLSGTFDEDGDYSGERKEVMEAFANNEFDILVNLGIATTGLDVPDIKTCVLCFSTMSLTKYLQCLGRAARVHPSKQGEFICLDMGANYDRLGRFEQDRTWHLWHNTSKGGGAPPMKECDPDKGGCGRLIPIQMTDCPFCGYHFPTQQETYRVELQEIINKESDEETLEQYVARKKLQGWKNNWILRDVCQKNAQHKKEVFMRAIKILNTNHGEKIKPTYWYFFKKNILREG